MDTNIICQLFTFFVGHKCYLAAGWNHSITSCPTLSVMQKSSSRKPCLSIDILKKQIIDYIVYYVQFQFRPWQRKTWLKIWVSKGHYWHHIVNVHFNLYTSESMCCRAITFTFSILQSWQWEGQSGLKDIRQCETLMGEWCLSDVGWLPTCGRLLTRFALAAFDDRWCQTHHLFAGESNHNRIFPFHVQPCQKKVSVDWF